MGGSEALAWLCGAGTALVSVFVGYWCART